MILILGIIDSWESSWVSMLEVECLVLKACPIYAVNITPEATNSARLNT